MSDQIVFHVPGAPRGKGRARSALRVARDKVTGKPRVFNRHYTPDETAAYESLARLAAAKAMRGREPYTGPIRMRLHIVMPIPQSWSGVRQRRAVAGLIAPTVKPDSDNIEKAIKDACNGGVYRDDVQVVEDSKRRVYGTTLGVTVEVAFLHELEPAQGRRRTAPAAVTGAAGDWRENIALEGL